MNRTKYIEASLILLLLILFGYAFNVTMQINQEISSDGVLGQNDNPRYHFVVISDDVKSYSWKTFIEGAYTETANKEIVLESYEIKDINDQNELNKAFEMARLSNVDGVMVKLSNNDLARGEIEACFNQGIKVITVGNDSPESKRDAYIGTNKFNLGKLTATLLADHNNDNYDVLLILGSEFTELSGASSNNYLNGLLEAFKSNEKIDELYVEYAAEKRAELIINENIQHRKIDAVICTDPIDSLRAIKVLIDLNQVGKVNFIASSDLPEIVEYIEKGTIQSSVVEDYKVMGNTSVEVLYQLIDRNRQSAYISIPIKIIDAQNLSITE